MTNNDNRKNSLGH